MLEKITNPEALKDKVLELNKNPAAIAAIPFEEFRAFILNCFMCLGNKDIDSTVDIEMGDKPDEHPGAFDFKKNLTPLIEQRSLVEIIKIFQFMFVNKVVLSRAEEETKIYLSKVELIDFVTAYVKKHPELAGARTEDGHTMLYVAMYANSPELAEAVVASPHVLRENNELVVSYTLFSSDSIFPDDIVGALYHSRGAYFSMFIETRDNYAFARALLQAVSEDECGDIAQCLLLNARTMDLQFFADLRNVGVPLDTAFNVNGVGRHLADFCFDRMIELSRNHAFLPDHMRLLLSTPGMRLTKHIRRTIEEHASRVNQTGPYLVYKMVMKLLENLRNGITIEAAMGALLSIQAACDNTFPKINFQNLFFIYFLDGKSLIGHIIERVDSVAGALLALFERLGIELSEIRPDLFDHNLHQFIVTHGTLGTLTGFIAAGIFTKEQLQEGLELAQEKDLHSETYVLYYALHEEALADESRRLDILKQLDVYAQQSQDDDIMLLYIGVLLDYPECANTALARCEAFTQKSPVYDEVKKLKLKALRILWAICPRTTPDEVKIAEQYRDAFLAEIDSTAFPDGDNKVWLITLYEMLDNQVLRNALIGSTFQHASGDRPTIRRVASVLNMWVPALPRHNRAEPPESVSPDEALSQEMKQCNVRND